MTRRRALGALGLVALLGLAGPGLLPAGAHGDAPPVGRPLFTEVTQQAGLSGFTHGGRLPDFDGATALFPEYSGPGGCWLDVDLDGWLDAFLVSGMFLTDWARNDVDHPHSRLYRNLGDGMFEDVSAAWAADLVGEYLGCAAADYDNDGRPDLAVIGYGGNALLHNEGGQFANVTSAAGVRGSQCGAELCGGTSATWLDDDRDGCLDLYVDHYGEYNL
ncbi:MAG: VCBS repeat-containing protein, partial [Halobacteriales archaeon]|nr:VCBS repeat-containing protein [Halobacteriales archaeon]